MQRTLFTRLPMLFSALFMCFALVFGACQVENDGMAEDELTENVPESEMGDEAYGDESGTSVSDLEGDPSEYVGRTVTVDGEIDERYGQNAFTIEGGLFSGDLLVIVPPSVQTAEAFNDDIEIQVTGEVVEYVQAEFESMYDWDLDYSTIDYEEREPVLIAQQIMAGDEMAVDNF